MMESSAAEKEQWIENDFAKAVAFQKQGEFDEAEKLYKKIILRQPEHLNAKLNYVILAINTENYVLGKHLCKMILKSGFIDENILVNYSICLIKLDEAAEAESILSEVLAVNPDNHAANGLLARVQLPGIDYLEYLALFHQWLKPKTYLEVGVDEGISLKRVNSNTQVIGIDPEPRINSVLPNNIRIFAAKSDDFFNDNNVSDLFGGKSIDLAFIDGLHRFDEALKDFINIEKYSDEKTVVLVHDCIPLNKATSTRERSTKFWSGDVWKLVLVLKKYRPDLQVFTIPASPTGLSVITNLDKTSNILKQELDCIFNDYLSVEYEQISASKKESLGIIEHGWDSVKEKLSTNNAV